MNYTRLSNLVLSATQAITQHNRLSPPTPAIESIINQMKFIERCSLSEKNPRLELKNGETFTYGIIASREFTSPEELELKKHLDDVTRELYPEDFI